MGGTGPVPTLGGSAAVEPTEGEGELLIDTAEVAARPTEGEGELLIDTAEVAAGPTEGGRELLIDTADLAEPTVGPTKREGELLVLAEVAVAAEGVGLATEGEGELLREVVGLEASNCACLARLLAAAFVCQPHEHVLFAERWKNDPC